MADTISFESLIGARLLEVPDYQRAFAWGEQQLREFWDDLDLIEPGGRHYTGTVVLRETGEVLQDEVRQVSLARAEVVDGQQRLTTIVILLDAILDRLELLGDVDATADRRRLLEARIGGVRTPKFQLGPDLRGFWTKAILNGESFVEGTGMATEGRLTFAATFFDMRLQELESAAGVDPIASLRATAGKLIGALQFSLYLIEDNAEAGVIFETLNQRGKPLTELEKVKNYLLFLASRLEVEQRDALSAEINECWRVVFVNLGRLPTSHEDQFLRAHWIATVEPDVRSWRGANSVKERFSRRRYADGIGDLYSEVWEYVGSLRQASAAYREIVAAGEFTSFGKAAGAAVIAATRLRNAGVIQIFAPLLMAARLVDPNDATNYLRLLDICERYSVRVFIITERRGNAGQSRLYSLARELFDSGDVDAAVAGVIDRIHYFASDEEVSADMLNTKKNWYAKPGHKYFLYEYEVFLLNGVPPAVLYDFFATGETRGRSTEHILPQSPEAECWREVFTQQEFVDLTHSLGNLVLTYDNSVYSNFCFDRKRDGVVNSKSGEVSPCYRTSTLKQEQRIAAWKTWDAKAIVDRQAELAAWAMKRWEVPNAEVVATATDDEPADGDL